MGGGFPQNQNTMFHLFHSEKSLLFQGLSDCSRCCKVVTLDALALWGNNAVGVTVLTSDDARKGSCIIVVTFVTHGVSPDR